MATGNATQQSFRRAIGALKDSTKVGIAKVNSDYKAIDVALVKATNHEEVLPKEKHVRTLFNALCAARPRADVMYCISSIAKRLAKTRTWTVALKTLIVIHRSLREVDPTVVEELSNYTTRGHMLNMAHFKDESSTAAWEYSPWVRTYALYLEECLECFRIVKYDIQRDRSRTTRLGITELLEQLPPMQQLLSRLLACQPEGAARYSFLIQYALSMVADESVALYVAITDGMLNLVDKFFEMERQDAVRAVEIYRKAMEQAEKLSELFETCRALEFGKTQKYIKIAQPPASFMSVMEDYIKDSPQTLTLPWKLIDKDGTTTPRKIILEAKLESDNIIDVEENPDSSTPTTSETITTQPIIDLLSFDAITEEAPPPEVDDSNALALAIINPDQPNGSSSWELELFAGSSSNTVEVTDNKLYQGGVLSRSMLDRLYDTPIPTTNTNGTYQTGNVSSNPFESNYIQDPFYGANNVALGTNMQIAPTSGDQESLMQYQLQQFMVGNDQRNLVSGTKTQIADASQGQESFMHLQEQQFMVGNEQSNVAPGTEVQIDNTVQGQDDQFMVGNDSSNPFGNPFADENTTSIPSQSHSPYPGLI